MTVDDRLRRAHARIPDPDEATIARARTRLAAAIAAGDEARAGGAAPDGEDHAASRGDAAPNGTDRPASHGGAAQRGDRPGGALPRGGRRPLRLALPAAALALAAAAAVALVPVDSETPVRPAAPTATPAADAAGVLATGKVFYQRNTFHMSTKYIGADGRGTASPQAAAYAISRSAPEEIWLAPDGSGRVVYGADSAPYLPTAGDERAWRAAGSPDLERLMGPPGRWGPKERSYGPGELERAWLFNSNLEAVLPSKDPLSVLPRGPRELAAFLEAAAEKQRPRGDERLVRSTFASDVLTFLRYWRTPDDLRAALLEVFLALPGTRPLGEITDAAGRTVTAIQLPGDIEEGRLVVAYDPASSRLMGEGGKLADGVRWNYTYEIATAGVARIGDRP